MRFSFASFSATIIYTNEYQFTLSRMITSEAVATVQKVGKLIMFGCNGSIFQSLCRLPDSSTSHVNAGAFAAGPSYHVPPLIPTGTRIYVSTGAIRPEAYSHFKVGKAAAGPSYHVPSLIPTETRIYVSTCAICLGAHLHFKVGKAAAGPSYPPTLVRLGRHPRRQLPVPHLKPVKPG